ncbi:MAG TPA: TonB-dependent receptor [Candidatus Tumulicola sp.]
MFPLIAAAVAAVAVSPTPSPSPVPEIAHVVTSDRSDESIARATRVTYVVTRDQIQRQGYRTVGDAIAAVPGVQLESYGAIGSNDSYGIRGSSSAQVLVLVNGLPAPGSFANSVNLGTFSTAGVARVEIVDGGGSTLYGTGAVGGIINVITDRAAQTSGALRWGSFGDRQLQAGAAGFSFERIVAANTYPLPAYTVGGTAQATSRQNADYESTTARYGGQRAFGAVDAGLNLSIDSTHGGAPGYYPYVSGTSRQDEVDQDGSLTLQTHGRRSQATAQFGGTVQQIAFDCNSSTDAACYQPSQSLSLESRVSVGLRNSVDAGAQRLLYGIDLSRGTVMTNTGGAAIPVAPGSTPPPAIASSALAQTAAYFEDVADVGHGSRAYAGVRAERDGGLGGEISPSLGFDTRLTQSLALKLNYATAFRAPNATELYYPGYGNPSLHPERARVGDVTLTESAAIGDVSFGWFANHTDDLIVPVLVKTYPSEYVYIYRPENVDHAVMQGLTLGLKTRPYHGVRVTLDVTDLYQAQDLSTGTRLPNDAVLRANVGVQIAGASKGAFGGAGISEQLVGSRGAVDYAQPSFFQPVAYANLTAFVDLRIDSRLDLFVRGCDLGNERYAEVAGYPMPGRSFALELRAK